MSVAINETFELYGLEALNHRSELKILWDTFRSQIAELWFPYQRRIAEDRTWFYLLRSSAGSQTIADDRATIAEDGAIVCDHDRRIAEIEICSLRNENL